MKNIYVFILLLVLVAASGYIILKPSTDIVSAPQTTVLVASKVFDIKGLNYSYDQKEIKVKLGDVVQINFTNTEGFHDFKIDEFNLATQQIKAGETESISFVADKAGTFEYYCSVGQHRANGMFGNLIVE
ncbi:MAG: cupredoxin domain-containing protein [Microgenomates group bacterium]